MTDLEHDCPKCGKSLYQYYNFVDNCGMGVDLPSGTYTMTCEEGYLDEDPPYCGHVFKVKVCQSVEVME